MFDAPVEDKCERAYDIDFPWDVEPWSVGLVVGPSGSGKSTVMRRVWGEPRTLSWSGAGIVDDFDASLSTEQIAEAVSSVGFSTVPAWVRPHHVLSMGEQFRADMARRMLGADDPIVVDEYTSVVDRQVAKIASNAIQKYVRARARRFVAVGCHYDVIDWLQPDWVLDMATQSFTRRRLQRRPAIDVVIGRLPRAAWGMFAPFHYMSASLPPSTHGFGLWAGGNLAASAWLAVFPHPTAKDIVRVARVVTLPDYQGIGLAPTLLQALGAALKAGGRRLRNYPAHGAFIAAHKKRPDVWQPIKEQAFGPASGKAGNAQGDRYCAVFEYCGPANPRFATALSVERQLGPSAKETADQVWSGAVEASASIVSTPSAAPIVSLELADLTIMNLVPALRPSWRPPYHLSEWCAAIERALAGHAREMCSIPFQHYKSSTTLVGIVWILLRRPTLKIILLTHSHDKAASMGKTLRELWKDAGGKTKKGFDTINEWETEQGGGCVVMSAAQSKLGYACDLLFVDDPLDELEYMIPSIRKRVDDVIGHYTARAKPHLDSVLIVASRWHPDDPIGRRVKRAAVEWRYLHFPGILGLGSSNERAFAPDVLDLEGHRNLRAEAAELDPTERYWWAQVQNEPLPDALGFFVGEFVLTEAVDEEDVLFGVDMAFTQGKKADHFAAVGGIYLPGDRVGIVHVENHQVGLTAGMRSLDRLAQTYEGCRFVTYTSGPERGVYEAACQGVYLAADEKLREAAKVAQINVEMMAARWNKATRAQKYAANWRAGKVLVLHNRTWTGRFLAEHYHYDGREDIVDDQVDAATAMHDALMMGRAHAGFDAFTFGRPVM